jgi:hypothetical protein
MAGIATVLENGFPAGARITASGQDVRVVYLLGTEP